MTDLNYPKICKSGAVYSETLCEYIPIEAKLVATSEASSILDIRLYGHVKVTDKETIQTLQDVPLTSPLLGKYIKILNMGEVVMRGQVSWAFRYVVSNEILTDPSLSKNITIDSYFTNLDIRAFLVDAQIAPAGFQEERTIVTQESLPNIDWEDY